MLRLNFVCTCFPGLSKLVLANEPMQPPLKLRNSIWCFISSWILFKGQAKALIRLRIRAGWSEALLVAHTTLLEISCHSSDGIIEQVCIGFGVFKPILQPWKVEDVHRNKFISNWIICGQRVVQNLQHPLNAQYQNRSCRDKFGKLLPTSLMGGASVVYIPFVPRGPEFHHLLLQSVGWDKAFVHSPYNLSRWWDIKHKLTPLQDFSRVLNNKEKVKHSVF